jgi:MSHA pilin protein MshC
MLAVILILGMLAAVAIPRWFDRSTYDALRFYDQAQATVRYAQKVAIAQRCTPVQVQVAANSIRLTLLAGACLASSTPLTIPGSSTPGDLPAPAGVTLSPATTFSFDGSGKPSFSSALTVSVAMAGEPTRTFVVEQETGYVHP